MPTYTHLLDEDISADERGRLGSHTLFTEALNTTGSGSTFAILNPIKNENHGGNASLKTAQAEREGVVFFNPRTFLPPELSQGTQRTDTATGGSRSASEAAQPLYNLYIGPGSYRLRPDGAEGFRSTLVLSLEFEGPYSWVIMLPATELPLEFVWLVPATEARRPNLFVYLPGRRLLSPEKLWLEKEDTHTGETREVAISVFPYKIGAGETPNVDSMMQDIRIRKSWVEFLEGKLEELASRGK